LRSSKAEQRGEKIERRLAGINLCKTKAYLKRVVQRKQGMHKANCRRCDAKRRGQRKDNNNNKVQRRGLTEIKLLTSHFAKKTMTRKSQKLKVRKKTDQREQKKMAQKEEEQQMKW
jgi:hypothetical protein